MREKLLSMIALLMLMAQGAWGWGGSGTSSDPWLIATTADWDVLATGAQGDTYSGKYFRQTADATVTTESELRTAVENNQTVTLGADITLSSGRLVISGTTVTLNLDGHTLSRSLTAADQDGQVIFLQNSGKLTITDADGNSGTITGGWAYQGGGIYVSAGCELTISGGTITGNRADQISEGGYGFGGGIENHGTTTLTGGGISGNNAGGAGNDIYQAGTLNIQGNPVTCSDIVNPIFNNVVINDLWNDIYGKYIDFVGYYYPYEIDEEGDNTILYLGENNTLYYPNDEMTINSFRAIFELYCHDDELVAGNPSTKVRAFVLNFGDGETSGIVDAEANASLFPLHFPAGTPSTDAA